MTILAIDFGTKRIGLAVARAGLAVPLKVIPGGESAFNDIIQVIETEAVDKVVVGISENTMAVKTREFAAELEEKIDIPIEFADETLSSKNVREKLKSLKKSSRTGPIDHFAAAEFLQEWIDIA